MAFEEEFSVEIPDDVAFDLDLMRGGISGARWIVQPACTGKR